MWVSTFHALCARLLRREAPAIGLSRDFVIYDSSDQLTVVKQALKAAAASTTASSSRARRCRASATRRTGWRARRRWRRGAAGTAATSRSRKIYALLPEGAEGAQRARLRRPAAQDRRALRAVASASASKYAEQFRFVMVDEYQDTNRPQYLLIRRLAEIHRNLCVVGDPDQSIYKWRGADLRNILDFEHDFPEADDRQARTQLPLDAGHPRRGLGGHQPEPQPQGQAPLDRPQGRRADRRTSAAATSSRKPTSSRARRATALADDVEATGRGALPHQRAVAHD